MRARRYRRNPKLALVQFPNIPLLYGQPLASLHLSMVRMGAPMMTVGGAAIRSQIGTGLIFDGGLVLA
jgi:hypothetical protein